MAMNFAALCNAFSRQKPGGHKPAPSVPRVIGQSCIMCVTRGTCLGSSCLGNKGRLFLLFLSFHYYFFQFFQKSSEKQIRTLPMNLVE